MSHKKEHAKDTKKNDGAQNAAPEVESTETTAKQEETKAAEGKVEAEVKAESDGKATEDQKAQESIDNLKEQVKSWNDRYLRLMAEFDNYKKRSSREYQAMVDSANERLMTDLVEVRENFERAIKNGEKSTDYNTLFEGLKLIFSKFDTVLTKYGLEMFAAPGDKFDPMVHDALMKAPHNEIPEDHVADIYERGYLLKGKVMKHARVIVSSGKPETNAAGDDSKK